MSAFTRLWHRAPLWRAALFTAGVCGILTVMFPAPWLASRLPAYGSLGGKIRHMIGADSTGSDKTDNEDSSNALHPDEDRRTVSAPPMDAQFEGTIPFAGRQLPLPAGKWHPLLNYQDDVAHGEILTSLYVRSEQGIVTGLLIAQATTQSLPLGDTQLVQDECHSTFNFMSESLPADGASTECWMTSPIRVVNNVFLTSNQALQALIGSPLFIPPAVQRLTMMGFDLPSVLVDAAWNRIEKSKSVQGKPGSDHRVDFLSVHALISPADIGSRAVPGAPENWSRAGMSDSLAVSDFVHRTNDWLRGWTPYLRQGFAGTLPSTPTPGNASADPAFHG
ncbi:hypothetical protein K2X14_05950 [Acetobacter sp. TBRC 12305]|uniref:Uncharacterized protein n=1 Tax=Acetobacter garciniae TaxID=2817435 RepID=A0A939HN33_9PROT|nr:hypothetical protein [Acetobacter garciniae]MBO1324693.1 hypothetical protein [Acetobacter garciniae]MBX0344383.1 hypothetical protein [Acetobacter garciniae]